MSQFNSMTLDDLITLLEETKDRIGSRAGQMKVTFASNYGDFGGTQQVHELKGECDQFELTETRYSVSGFALRPSDADEDEPMGQMVLVIS